MFTRFMFTLHRVTGTLLSLLFVVWFVSGIVMMYHGFPRVTADDRLALKRKDQRIAGRRMLIKTRAGSKAHERELHAIIMRQVHVHDLSVLGRQQLR